MRRRYENDKDGYGTEMMMQPDPYCLQHDLTVPSANHYLDQLERSEDTI